MGLPALVVGALFVALLVPSTEKVAWAVAFVLTAVGLVSVLLRLMSRMSNRVVPALVTVSLAAALPLIGTFVEWPSILWGLLLAAILVGLGVDQLRDWASNGFALDARRPELSSPSSNARLERCHFADKRIYYSQEDARRHVASTRENHGPAYDTPLDHEYYCDSCGYWHVSSQPKRG